MSKCHIVGNHMSWLNLFSRIAFEHIFVTLNIRYKGMIYLHCTSVKDKVISPFCENINIAKISEFTVNLPKDRTRDSGKHRICANASFKRIRWLNWQG